MYRLVRIVAFSFKSLNFLLDIWQTWQFAGGGGMVAVITGITAYFSGKPMWIVVVLAVAVAFFVVCITSLVFKSFAHRVTDNKRLKRLSRLVLDTHRQISSARRRVIIKTDWDKVDVSKVIPPILDVFGSMQIDDNKVVELESKLSQSGGILGVASVPDAIMEKSDSSLAKALRKDIWYRYLSARLDTYKPYPDEAIGNLVSQIINASFSLNNALILQSYIPLDSLSLESLSSLTEFSDVMRMRVYETNVQAEKKIDEAIEKVCTRLNVLVLDYLEKAKAKK